MKRVTSFSLAGDNVRWKIKKQSILLKRPSNTWRPNSVRH